MDDSPSTVLQRIARALKRPQSELFETPSQSQTVVTTTVLDDTREILSIFTEITCSKTRRICIDYARAAAEQSI